MLVCVSLALLPVAIVMAILNLCCWNKLVFLVLPTVAANAAGNTAHSIFFNPTVFCSITMALTEGIEPLQVLADYIGF